MKRALNLSAIVLILLLPMLFSQEEKRVMEIDDLWKFDRIGNPCISPDGQWIVYTVSKADWESNGNITHIWRVRADGTDAVQMTRGDKSCGSPVWSPCGKLIAFTTSRSGKSQIWLMRNDGGEAWKLTDHATDVGSIDWPENCRTIYFLAEEDKTEEDKAKEKDKNQVIVVDKNLKSRHLWAFDKEKNEERRLTKGDYSIRSFVVSPDKKNIVFTAAPTPKVDDNLKIEIYLLTLDGGEVKRLTENVITEGGLRWRPDGKAITFESDSSENLETYYQTSIFELPLDGGPAKDLLPGFVEEVQSHEWIDESKILFAANTGVNVHLFSLDLAGGEVKQLTEGDMVIYPAHFLKEKGLIAAMITDPLKPADINIADVATLDFKKVTDCSPQIDEFKLAQYRTIRWTASDGYEAEGILILPPDYEEGKRYPLIVQLHGGPESSYKNGFSTSWGTYPHVLAGRGYVLFQPNYRGSTGYGDEVMRAIIGRYFESDIDDIITGVDYLIAQGIADPDKMGCHGWSAGGHLTNWLVTHYSDRFKAAGSGAGGANWFSFYAQTDMHYIREIWFTGPPYERSELFREKSPVNYVRDASTPTIIFCGANDNRVPAPQSWEMYIGLQRYGVTSEFRLYPGEPHGLRKLAHQKDKVIAELAWFDKFILGKEPEPPKAEAEKESK
jgi:dipeptidyl aminopeptidase/acylaminoacyl peptidase